ncbi:MAG: hypothetical protein WBA12_09070, partial [Catalinimonas sp.]
MSEEIPENQESNPPKKRSLAARIGRIALKTVLILLLVVVGLLVLVWGALQVPAVQQFAADKATTTLSEQLGTEVSVGGIDIDFFKTVVLEDIYVEDERSDTLLYAGRFGVDIGVFGLFSKTIVINEVKLEDAYVNVYRPDGDTLFNYAFILAAFASDTTKPQQPKDTTASPWSFDAEGLVLENIRLNYLDSTGGTLMRTRLASLRVDLSTLGLDGEVPHPEVDLVAIEGLDLWLRQTGGATAADGDTTLAEAVAANPATDTTRNDTMRTFVEGFALTLTEFRIDDTRLRYQTDAPPPEAGGIDYNNLDLQDLTLRLQDVVLGDSTVRADLNQLAFREQSGFELKNLALAAEGNFPGVRASLDEFTTPHSRLTDLIEVSLRDFRDEEELIRTLAAHAEWNDDYLGMRDVVYFVPALDSLVALRGRELHLTGTVDVADGNLDIRGAEFRVDDEITLGLTADAEAYFDPLKAKFNLKIDPLRTDVSFIQQFLQPGTLPPDLQRLGAVSLYADVSGYARDMQGNLRLVTSAGRVGLSRFDVQMSEDFQSQRIDAMLTTDKLDLTRFVGDSAGLGLLTLRAEADVNNSPAGLSVRNGKVRIERFDYNEYTYNDIRLDGSFVDNVADARITATDTNLRLALDARADLRPEQPLYTLSGRIDTIDLAALNLYTDTLMMSVDIDEVRVRGNDPNTLDARVALRDLRLQKDARTVGSDSIVVRAFNEPGAGNLPPQRVVDLHSDFMRADLRGQFTVEELPKAFEKLVAEYVTSYRNPVEPPPAPQRITLDVDIAPNPGPIQAFVPDLQLSDSLTLDVKFYSGDNDLEMLLDAGAVAFQANRVSNLRVETTTDDNDKLVLLASADQVVAGATSIPRPKLRIRLDEDNFGFDVKLAGDEAPNRLSLTGALILKGDTFRVEMDDSEFMVKEREWTLAKDAVLAYAPEYLYVDNFAFARGEQQFEVFTKLDANGTNVLNTNLRAIDLAELAYLLDQEQLGLSGRIGGRAEVVDPFKLEKIQADISIDSLALNDQAIGQVKLNASKSKTEELLAADLTMQGTNFDVEAGGTYNVAKTEDNLDFKVDMNKFRLEPFEPLLTAVVHQIKGNMRAQLSIAGSPTAPIINGDI